MTPTQARRILHAVHAVHTIALDGPGPARRGWFIARGAKTRCWLGRTALEAVERLDRSERAAAARTVNRA